MGEASKKRRVQDLAMEKLGKVDLSRLAKAVRSVSVASSESLGRDCFIHAWLAQEVLKTHEIASVIEVGFSAWRVGPGDGDVITHHCSEEFIEKIAEGIPSGDGKMHLPYHVWLEVAGHILDLTTYQLPLKAMLLDRSDGGETSVEWCPDFLFEPIDRISSFENVKQYEAGLFYYKKSPPLKKVVFSSIVDLDPLDVATVMMAYKNPQAVVIGPNHMR